MTVSQHCAWTLCLVMAGLGGARCDYPCEEPLGKRRAEAKECFGSGDPWEEGGLHEVDGSVFSVMWQDHSESRTSGDSEADALRKWLRDIFVCQHTGANDVQPGSSDPVVFYTRLACQEGRLPNGAPDWQVLGALRKEGSPPLRAELFDCKPWPEHLELSPRDPQPVACYASRFCPIGTRCYPAQLDLECPPGGSVCVAPTEFRDFYDPDDAGLWELEDGDLCTTTVFDTRAERCDVDARDCTDAFACTSDDCNRVTGDCVNEITEGCLIDGTCWAENASNPLDPLESCRPDVSRTGWTGPGDTDGDGIPDSGHPGVCTGGQTVDCNDNCPTYPNPLQEDSDADGLGDICDFPPGHGTYVNAHVWSPDSSQLALILCLENRPYDCDLVVADPDVINPAVVQTGLGAAHLLDWTEDWILFMQDREDGLPDSYYGGGEAWKVHPDGTGLTQLTFTFTNGIRTEFTNHAYDNIGTTVWAAFVPGSDRLYFQAHNGNGWHATYTCNTDGSDGWAAVSPGHSWAAALSPAGDRLLYAEASDYDQPMTVVAVDLDGSNPVTLGSGWVPWLELAVSPDGLAMAYTESSAELRPIRLVGMDGSLDREVVAADFHHSLRGFWDGTGYQATSTHWAPWSPDSQYIFFSSDRDGYAQIHRVRPDGSELTRVSSGPFFHFAPKLSPDGQRISYHRVAPEGIASWPWATTLVIVPFVP